MPDSLTLADVDIRAELDTRPRRLPDLEREDRAFHQLTAQMAENPRDMLQSLVEIAKDLCGADTAGISLLEGDVFRWEAVAGVFAGARGGTMPRTASPCGVCIDRNATQLMHLADRYFPALVAEPRFVEALLIPFHDHGRPIGTVWIVSHSLERKFGKDDERIVGLLARVASVGWQLWKTAEAAATHNRQKEDFLATLGHELRNPLASIMTAAGIVQLRVTHDAAVAHAAAVITRQCRHMSRLMDDMLDVARIHSGKLQLERCTTDVRTVVAESIEMRRAQIERRKHVLTIDLGVEPMWVEGDPVRLTQVISNLVDNAAKYTPDSGRISVVVSSERNDVVVVVRDTGVGIPAEQAERIFEPFTQLNPIHDSAAGGLGLGLALVRSLAELHGGRVEVVSAGPNQGSCFTVRLPMRSPLPHAAKRQSR